MILKMLRVCLSLVLFGGAFAFAAPAVAGSVTTGAGEAMTATGSSSSPATPPSGPADSGTGETTESKETRVDYAPYVIGAIVVVVLVTAFLFWRKRGITRPTKPN